MRQDQGADGGEEATEPQVGEEERGVLLARTTGMSESPAPLRTVTSLSVTA